MHLWHKQQRTRQVEGSQKPTDSLGPNEPERAGSGAAEALGSRPVARSCLSHRGDEPEGLCWAGNWPLLHKQYCSQQTAVNSQTGGGIKGLAPLGVTVTTATVGDGGESHTSGFDAQQIAAEKRWKVRIRSPHPTVLQLWIEVGKNPGNTKVTTRSQCTTWQLCVEKQRHSFDYLKNIDLYAHTLLYRG